MTKHQELDALRDLAARLGPDSYVGPWLDFILPAVESSILSDIVPLHLDPRQARIDALAILDEARQEAAKITTRAAEKAAEIEQRATREARLKREAILTSMRQAVAILDRA